MEENIFIDIAQLPKNNTKAPRLLNNIAAEPFPLMLREPLTTKNAVKFLLEGTLKTKVCRYCLSITSPLAELDQIMQVARNGTIFKVTIRDMLASFHPFKIAEDLNFPNRICDKCINDTLKAYIFTQQCEQAERALRNCFEDMNEKMEKLDPLEPRKRRGRQKLKPNHNVLHAEHAIVMDYAEPIINIVNTSTEMLTNETKISEFECAKCWQVLPSIELLINHEKSHPKNMWFSCRLCGKSFPKRSNLKRHSQEHLDGIEHVTAKQFKCNTCSSTFEEYGNFLQHVEKHKFKTIMEHLVHGKMDKLCTVCLDKGKDLTDLENMVRLHGGCMELSGDKTLYSILGSSLPDMNIIHNYTGTKICVKCFNQAITSFIFINNFNFVRSRLNTCISLMLNDLNNISSPSGNLFVEILESSILPNPDKIDENLLANENDYIDEQLLKIDVLEDEFREEISESESSESEKEKQVDDSLVDIKQNIDRILENAIETITESGELENPARNAVKTYSGKRLVNGYEPKDIKELIDNICGEFLTFKKKDETKPRSKVSYYCPLCYKLFISEYFLRRHARRHVNLKTKCNQCDRKFQSKFHVFEHMKTHLISNTHMCNICGRNFTKVHKLIKHKTQHSVHNCVICTKQFVSQKQLYNHMQKHIYKLKLYLRRRAQTCSFCEKECPNDNQLSLHVNKVHLQIKPYHCDMCERKFYTENNLRSHKRVHNRFSLESCAFCSKIVKSRSKLVVHVREHIGVTPYKCQICSQSFYSQNKLRKHMSSNHGGRFCCKFCRIVFTSRNALKSHVINAHSIF